MYCKHYYFVYQIVFYLIDFLINFSKAREKDSTDRNTIITLNHPTIIRRNSLTNSQ